MKIKRNQLKNFVKGIVREAISESEYEQILNEVSPPGKKAEKMIHHVKSSLRKSHPDWDEDKVTSVAIATGWKAHNKGSVEESGQQIPKGSLAKLNPGIVKGGNKKPMGAPTGKLPSPVKKANEAGLTSETNPDNKQSALDDVVRLVIKRGGEKGLTDPQKIAQVASQLFQHQTGWAADPEALQASIQRNMNECGAMEEEGDVPPFGGEETGEIPGEEAPEGEHGYDEKEEILLIKVMKKVAEKLEAMHAGEDAGVGEPEIGVEPEGGEGDIEGKPFGADDSDLPTEPEGGEEEPSEEPEPESDGEPSGNPFGKKSKEKPEKEEPEKEDDDDNPIKEGSAKTQTSTYKVAPNPSCLTQKDDKDRLSPKDPRLTETKKKGQYKVVAPRMAQVQKDDQAKRVADEPNVNETAYKTQGPSYKTFEDSPQFPDAVNDPENA